MTILRALSTDTMRLAAQQALLLWPEHSLEDLWQDFSSLLGDSDAAVFLARDAATPVGFAQCQLRRDYVEGTSSSPVGYLEGIYVAPSHRKQGLAAALLKACEAWAAGRGCKEFASDCELLNEQSRAFHLRAGFAEVGRLICFTKPLR